MNKQKVMEALLDVNSNVSYEIISFIGNHLGENCEPVKFKHDECTVWEACGLTEQETKDFSRKLNKYMNDLPEDERQKSKAVEFVVNSGNKKWITIATIIGLQKIAEDNEPSEDGIPDDFKKLLMSALKRKFKRKDEE